MSKRSLFSILAIFSCLHLFAANEQICVMTDHDLFYMEVDSSASFSEVSALAQQMVGDEQEIVIAPRAQIASRRLDEKKLVREEGGSLGYPRDYSTCVSDVEKQDLHYIVTTLAKKSLVSLAMSKGELECAGERIEHLHPLRFLMTIFTDEEMKVSIKNIRKRGWVWNNFLSGLKNSLVSENLIGNMKECYIVDFARAVEIDPRIILPAAREENWNLFVDLLIRYVPRKGNPGRYD